jgi:hypothetical protein
MKKLKRLICLLPIISFACNSHVIRLQTASPNKKWEVFIIEKGNQYRNSGDRNFDLMIKNRQDGKETLLFSSPDEGKQGSEIIIWAKNNKSFILCGNNFVIDKKEDIKYKNKSIYLLYDMENKRFFCNALQRKSSISGITQEVLNHFFAP